MDDYLLLCLILAAISLILALLIIFQRLAKKKKSLASRANETLVLPNKIYEMPKRMQPKIPLQPIPSNLLVINIFAKENAHFASYDLLQTIANAGMQYGEMNIFHYFANTEYGRMKLFSLASATEPGEFQLDKIGGFTCLGLSLFLDLRKVPDPPFAFKKMLAVAELLADDLDGDLFSGMNMPLTPEMLNDYVQQILESTQVTT